ncbi:hypothetical protein BC829DRAFT_442303 [Chytridium lagenaria]|nr:hypothetical protein BC829DRAFT_442303 [Chytridium lagenaria]
MDTGPNPRDVGELLKVLESTPLFMSRLDKDEDNETLAALQSLVYDGTPDGNFRKAINDCAEAIKVNPKNVKAYYRSVKALFSLDRFEEALDSCIYGLKIEPTNVQLKAEKARIEEKVKQKAAKEKKSAMEKQMKSDAENKIISALKERNIVTTTASKSGFSDKRTMLFGDQAKLGSNHLSGYRPEISTEEGGLTVPVIFLYPEFEESDIISHFHELDSFQDHLELMFSDINRPLWDKSTQYVPESINVYFEARSDLDPSLQGKPKIYQVDASLPLLKALQHEAFRLSDVESNDEAERNDLIFMGSFLHARRDSRTQTSSQSASVLPIYEESFADSSAVQSNLRLQGHLRSLLRSVDNDIKENAVARHKLGQAVRIASLKVKRDSKTSYFCDDDGRTPEQPQEDIDVDKKKVIYLHRKARFSITESKILEQEVRRQNMRILSKNGAADISDMNDQEFFINVEGINWDSIARHIPGRSGIDCRTQWTTNQHPWINKRPFTREELQKLKTIVEAQDEKDWTSIAETLGVAGWFDII